MRIHASVRSWSIAMFLGSTLIGCGSTPPTPPPDTSRPDTSRPAASASGEPSEAIEVPSPRAGASAAAVATSTVGATPTPTSTAAATASTEPIDDESGEEYPVDATAGPTAATVRVGMYIQPPGGNRAVAGIASGDDHVDIVLGVPLRNVDRSKCKIRHSITPDKPGVAASVEPLKPLAKQTVALIDGNHDFRVSCRVSKQVDPTGVLSVSRNIRAADGLPEKCLGFTFKERAVSVGSFQELRDGVVGRWSGCVTAPSTPPFWVDLQLRADGTYSARTDESFDGSSVTSTYPGTNQESPFKTYEVNDIQADMEGIGQMDVVWAYDVAGTRLQLQNIRLMGDELRFELGSSQPMTFRLKRVADSD